MKKYTFYIKLCPQGDFEFPFMPQEMSKSEGEYSLHLEFEDYEMAKSKALNILSRLKEEITPKEDFLIECFDGLIQDIEKDIWDSSFQFNGNILSISTQEDFKHIMLYFSDEEHQKVKNYDSDHLKKIILEHINNPQKYFIPNHPKKFPTSKKFVPIKENKN